MPSSLPRGVTSSSRPWFEQTPEDFCFAVKGGRYITHLKRLHEPETPLAHFFTSGMLALGDKLGPVPWQLAATVSFGLELIIGFLALLPRTTDEAAELAERGSRSSVAATRDRSPARGPLHRTVQRPAARIRHRTGRLGQCRKLALLRIDAAPPDDKGRRSG